MTAHFKLPTSAKARLGTNAELSPPPSAKTPEGRMAARSERYRAQAHAQKLLWDCGVREGLPYPQNFHKTTKCLRVRVADQVDIHQSIEHQSAFYGGGLVTCGKAGCPVCSAKIQERRREEIAKMFDHTYDLGGKKIVMVTLTFSHNRDQSLKELLTLQAECLKRLRKGAAWDKFKEKFGFGGMVRSLEITRGSSGWHPHTHEAWIVSEAADAAALREFVTERWLRICQAEGLCPAGKEAAFREHSVDVIDNCRSSDYLAKMDETASWGIDRELAKSSTKKGRKAGRSIFQILADATDGCRYSDALYLEFVQAIKGRPIIRWSQGLKAQCGVDELTDEELAAAQEDKALPVALLSAEDWKCVTAHGARAHILQLIEEGGETALRRWLSAPEIPSRTELKMPDPPAAIGRE